MRTRRQYLATGAVVGGVALSGCTSMLAAEHSLIDSAEDGVGPTIHHTFEHEGDAMLEISLTRRPDVPGIARLLVDIVQPQETRLEGMDFRLTSDLTADHAPAGVYVEPPRSGGWSDYALYREGDWTVVEVEDFGRAAGSTTGFEAVIHGDIHGDETVPPVIIDAGLTLAEDGPFGDRFTATLRTSLDLEEMA